jgi:glycosyltransferase involved in cell wall biosynthesis
MLYWYPYEGPLQPIYGRVFEDLMSKGHSLTIVTSFPHFRKGRSETWEEYRGKLFEVGDWRGAKLIRSYVYAPVFRQDKKGLMYRALNFVSFNISCIAAALLYGGRADIIFAPSSPPLTNGICAWIISLWKRSSVVYNVQDMYPDMAEKLGLVRNNIAIFLLRGVERLVYRLSDIMLVLSEAMQRNIMNKGVPPGKILVIPNPIDTAFIRPLPSKNRFSEKWGLDGHFVVMYAGNIGLPHGTEVIIQAAELVKKDPDILVCFVGRGEYRHTIEKLSKSKTLNNVLFIPPQPEEEVPYIWASASVSLVTYRRGLSADSMPSKLLAIMSSGRPVVAAIDKESEAYRMVEDAKCGLCVEPENPHELAGAIIQLKQDKGQREAMGRRGRGYLLHHFNRSVISDLYEEVFLSLRQPLTDEANSI